MPANICIPNIPKMAKMKQMRVMTLVNAGMLANRVMMMAWRPGKAVRDFNGRSTRNVRIADTFAPAISTPNHPKISINEVNTMTKSRTFQPSLRYEPLSRTKPIPQILKKNSNMNIIVKT